MSIDPRAISSNYCLSEGERQEMDVQDVHLLVQELNESPQVNVVRYSVESL